MVLIFYNINNVPNTITYPDIYFTPQYGKLCELSDNAIWELCQYKDLIYVYLKKDYFINDIQHFKLITPYGYSGYYYNDKNTYLEFLLLFKDKARELNYIEEVVRQNPYLKIEIDNYKIIKTKIVYGINISDNNFDYYYKNILNCSTRNMYTKAIKLNLSFTIKEFSVEDIVLFRRMYNKTMDAVNSDPYYYFNDDYFNLLVKFNNIKICFVKNADNKIIGQTLIFLYNNYVHYHLSCNDKSYNCITDFILINLVKNYSKNIIILGGGLEKDDNLCKFKKKFSNISFEYKIFNNILT